MRLLLVGLGLLGLAFAGCKGQASTEEEVVPEGGTSAQNGTLPDEIGTFRHEGATPVVVLGRTTFAITGDRVAELQDGRRYKLSLARAEGQVDGFNVRRLVDFWKVRKLVGTLADDVQDPSVVHLRSLHEKGYVLTGDSVGAYRETRAGLPSHDYTKTFFRVNAVEERGSSIRFEWLDYEPVPLYRCAEKTSPQVHLDLINVRPDDSILDGFVATDLGHESQLGAHAECQRDGAAYTCALDDLSGKWGTSRFVPTLAGSFDLVIERSDTARTRVSFACSNIDRAALTNESED